MGVTFDPTVQPIPSLPESPENRSRYQARVPIPASLHRIEVARLTAPMVGVKPPATDS